MELPPSRWRRFKDFGRNNWQEIAIISALFLGTVATVAEASDDSPYAIPADACVFSNNYDPAAIHPVPVSGPKQYGEAVLQIVRLDPACIDAAEDDVRALNDPPRANDGYLLVPTEQVFESRPQN